MRRVLTILLCGALLSVAAGCADEQADAPDRRSKVRVVASIFPIADVVRQIGGDRVEVACMLAGGMSPHDFQPSPQHAEQLAEAQLVVVVGLGVDAWAAPAAEAAARHARLLTLTEETANDHEEAHDAPAHEHAHHHGGRDPHVWLDPVIMQEFVRRIADELSQIDPSHASAYTARRDAYIVQLCELDALYRQMLADVPRKQFVTFHTAFTYIAERYGLEQRSLHTADARGFGPQHLEQVAQFVREHEIRAIFAEPQFPPDKLQALAEATGASVGVLDPLGRAGQAGYDSYLAMMRSNLDTLAAALKD